MICTKCGFKHEPIFITPKEIINHVLFFHNLKIEDVASANRKGVLVRARQQAAFLIYAFTILNESSIGELLGGKDRTTILHSRKVVGDLMETDSRYRLEMDYFFSLCGGIFTRDPFPTKYKKKPIEPKKVIVTIKPEKYERPKAEYTNISSPYKITRTA